MARNKSKNIVLCSDGTGNVGGNGDVTNVWRLYNALDLSKGKASEQVAIHDDGVGTEENKIYKSITGAFGIGLQRNVRELYQFLIRNYEPNNKTQIYIFGFSRGAYTARMLAELISICGIVDRHGKTDKQIEAAIKQACDIFRYQFLNSVGDKAVINKIVRKWKLWRWFWNIQIIEPKKFIKKNCYSIDDNGASTPYLIRFLGVWDTVPAYGFPLEWLADFWNSRIYPFKFNDRKLHPRIRKAVHALAADEQRKTFRPMLFDQSLDKNKGLPLDRVEQVWFPGVHANIGGGYPKDGLSHISLNWMMDKAEKKIDGTLGLSFIKTIRNEYAAKINPYAKMYDSRSGMAVFYRYEPRDIYALCKTNGFHLSSKNKQIPIKIHSSIIERILSRTEQYAPGNIPAKGKLEGSVSKRLEKIMARYKKESNGYESLLGQVRNMISLRQSLHGFKLFLPVAAFAIGWINKDLSLTTKSILNCKSIPYDAESYLSPINELISKLTPLVPCGEKLQSLFISPILTNNFLSIIFMLVIFLAWGVGKGTKKRIIKNHSDFWTKFSN